MTRRNKTTAGRSSIGPYRIVEELGRGAMGIVYVAEDERLGRRVALKTLGEVRGGDARDRLWREARSGAGLNHPGICQVYDVQEVGDELWVAMELLEGEGLDVRIGRERFGTEEAVTLCLEILEPLGFLHDRGLVHRDVKPSNIFLTPVGTKLLDFGLARTVDGPADTRLTQTAAILGTPHYMAPEQWRAKGVGPRSDLFSCGAILYEMLTGRLAFGGRDAIEIFHAAAHEQPPPLTGSAAIEAVDRVLRRAIAKDPTERYASATEMGDALKEALERARSLQTAGGRRTPSGERQAETIQRFIALPFRMLRPDPEIEFLTTSLPEAIGASLSGLQHLVVRSTRLAEGQSGSGLDLKNLAAEAEVDYALAGNLMSAGSRVRLSAELLQVPAGTVVWSLQEDFVIEDLFQLQDDLANKVVEGVAIPLSPREEKGRHTDEPASAKGYELYLRALHALPQVRTPTEAAAVKDLLKAAIEEDPSFAPAWAQYARGARLIAKYHLGDPEEHLALAGDAFKHAFVCNPDSALAHQLYTYYQLEELGDSRGAMLRLLELVRDRTADAHLWAGLVPAFRFSGLYKASIAAHQRARALDPKIETSVQHTYFQLAEWDRALGDDLSPGPEWTAIVKAVQGKVDEALTILKRPAEGAFEGATTSRDDTLAVLEGRVEDVIHITEGWADGMKDPDALYFLTRALAQVGATAKGLKMAERTVDRGWYSIAALERDPWLESLRGDPKFESILSRAREGRAEALAAFREAGGEKLLGVIEE